MLHMLTFSVDKPDIIVLISVIAFLYFGVYSYRLARYSCSRFVAVAVAVAVAHSNALQCMFTVSRM